MRNNEIIKKLKKMKFTEGRRSTHVTYWNCPDGTHVVGVGNHPPKECHFLNSILRDLGPHKKDFK